VRSWRVLGRRLAASDVMNRKGLSEKVMFEERATEGEAGDREGGKD